MLAAAALKNITLIFLYPLAAFLNFLKVFVQFQSYARITSTVTGRGAHAPVQSIGLEPVASWHVVPTTAASISTHVGCRRSFGSGRFVGSPTAAELVPSSCGRHEPNAPESCVERCGRHAGWHTTGNNLKISSCIVLTVVFPLAFQSPMINQSQGPSQIDSPANLLQQHNFDVQVSTEPPIFSVQT
jgi:hypothetical protein